MIGNTLQSLPIDALDIGIVQPGQLVAHDPAHGVAVLKLVGECGKDVAQDPERCALGPLDLQVVAQLGKVFSDGIDVGGFFILHPSHPAIHPENQVVFIPRGKDRRQGGDSLRPERNLARRHPLSSDGIDSREWQLQVNALQDGAIGSAESAIQAKQDHRLELASGLVDQGPQGLGFHHPVGLAAAKLGRADFFETLPQPNGIRQPAAFVGVVEHGDDARTLAVVSVPANLAEQVPPIVGEIFRPQVTDEACARDVFQEAVDSPAYVGHVTSGYIACLQSSLLFVGERIGQLLEGERSGLGDDARLATFVQGLLHPIVFNERGNPIPVLPEIVQMAVNSLLESPVGAWLGGESLDGRDLVGFATTGHADRLTTANGFCKCIQLSSQVDYARLENMRKPVQGSVAQRLEQGTHNPLEQTTSEENNADSKENGEALSAQSPNRSGRSSRVNTRAGRRPRGKDRFAQHRKLDACQEARQFDESESAQYINDLIQSRFPIAFTGYKISHQIGGTYVYFLLLFGRVMYVGRSKELPSRIGQHWCSDKWRLFDEVRYVRVPPQFGDFVERQFISHYRPPLNLDIPCPFGINIISSPGGGR